MKIKIVLSEVLAPAVETQRRKSMLKCTVWAPVTQSDVTA